VQTLERGLSLSISLCELVVGGVVQTTTRNHGELAPFYDFTFIFIALGVCFGLKLS